MTLFYFLPLRLLPLLRLLLHLPAEKNADEDITLQAVFAIFKLLLHEESRRAVTRHESLSETILSLVVDPHHEIRKFAHMCLDIIVVSFNFCCNSVLSISTTLMRCCALFVFDFMFRLAS